jgi:type IV secretion system protein VirB2
MTLQQTASVRLRALVATKNVMLATKRAHMPVMVMAGLALATPARAQTVDLSPITTLLQGLVDAMTGPLGIVLGTLALIGVFGAWFFGYIDFSRALWVLVAIVGIAASPVIVGTVFGAA